MALQVWLPLTKNLKNFGIANTTIANNGAVYGASTGKLGGGYTFSNCDISIRNLPTTFTNGISIAFWMKPSNTTQAGCLLNYRTAMGGDLAVFLVSGNIRFDAGGMSTFDYVYTTEWLHVCLTYNNSKKTLYINGVKLLEISLTTAVSCTATAGTIGRSSTNSTSGASNMYVGILNDYRIYNNCLTADEVKELSLGKVLHLTLCDGFHKELLIDNTANWSGTASTDHPEGSSVSIIGECWFSKPICIEQDHSYTLSMYVKGNASPSSTYMYPSIKSFDIDGKNIANINCPDGFSSTYVTTLARDLNPNDTVVYCTNLSNWTTATNNHYYYISLFYYFDSAGNKYDNYTQYSLPFGTYSDKSKLNTSNNTITLNSAYKGITIPAGTRVCQTTAGSTWYYPYGGIAQASTPNWTLKTVTFTPSNVNRLRYARTIQIGSLYNGYLSNIKLIDNTLLKVYDISGNLNDANVGGTVTFSTDTPRYDRSLVFTNSSYLLVALGAKVTDSITVNLWAKFSSYGANMISCTESGGWNFEKNGDGLQFVCNISGESYISAKDPENISTYYGAWHMFTGTYDRKAKLLKLYVDGVCKATTTSTTGNIIAYNASNSIFIGAEAGTSATTPASNSFSGNLSDARIYATALSATDIMNLFKLGR